MTEIVFNCKKHSDLTVDQVYVRKRKYPNEKIVFSYLCRECYKTKALRSYVKNRDKRIEYAKAWAKNNKDKTSFHYLTWRKKNKYKYGKYQKKIEKLYRDKLDDIYIKKLLHNQGYAKELWPELIPFKKATILLKREIKKNGSNKKDV